MERAIVVSPWLNYQEAAEYLGIKVGTLRNWVSTHHVPFARRGRVVRFNRAELDRWLEESDDRDQQADLD